MSGLRDINPGLTVVETGRLRLRQACESDAPFILRLLNEPSWIKNIGDRGVHNLDDARNYIENNLCAMYAEHGFGLFVVLNHAAGEPMGLCGILQRPGLDDVDIGYAFLPQFHGQGYALEASRATVQYALQHHGLKRLVAITLVDNVPSVRLLEKLGFAFEKLINLPADPQPLALYSWQAAQPTWFETP